MSNWPSVPIRRLFRVVNGGTPTGEPDNWDGDIPWATPIDLAKVDGGVLESTERTLTDIGLRTGSRTVPTGSIVVSTRAPIGYVAQVEASTAFNQGCRGLEPTTAMDIRFFRYQMSAASGQIAALGQGSTFVELSTEQLAGFPVVAAPLEEQRTIADYLDRETARIDALIAAKRRMLHLLDEKWRGMLNAVIWSDAIATAALMHLVDPARPVMYGIVLPGPDVGPGGVAIVKGGDVAQGRLCWDLLCKTTPEIEAPYARARLRGGDLVFAIRGGIGDVAIVPEVITGANITQDVARISTRRGVDARWLMYALQSPTAQSDTRRRVTGATITGLNIWELDRVRVPSSTTAQQLEHRDALDVLSAGLSSGRTALLAQCSLLKERRQALITAAVTGQIAVPVAA